MAQARLFPKSLSHLLSAALATASLVLPISGLLSANAQTAEGWSVCNETSMIVEAATGRPNQSTTIIEGWTRIRPGECRVVLPAPLQAEPYYLYARSSKAHRNGTRVWAGDYEFCVDTQGSFSVESAPSCEAMGLEPRKFKPIMIESRNRWKTTLKETQKWTAETARNAGVQRLLNDAGVENTTLDGYIGRRTRGAIAEFLREHDLPSDTDDSQLIDALEQTAIERSRDLGLMICNRADERIWSAIGRRRGEGWESRGWWPIEAGACERVVDASLLATEHYVYAEMEAEAGMKRLAGGNEAFCVSRTKFAILGRTTCEQEHYDQVDFVTTDVPEDGKLVFEIFGRDMEFVEQPESETE
ncbi:DUF1036 domain-containing protein [Ponticaulis profundi]|uniref:DUF1036 domain-containing protein n=1 Tax=Ponticaulis profundi TaxID=2665222 RepID=UPI00366BBA13